MAQNKEKQPKKESELSEIEKAKKLIQEAEEKEKKEVAKFVNDYLTEKGYTLKVINQLQGNVIVNAIDIVKVK
jgi:uncharacterized protein (UPF0297 family)